MSILIEAADAILGWLAAEYPTAVVERVYCPVYELKDLDALHLTVVPMEQTITRISRKEYEWLIRVDVGVLQRLSSDDRDAETDGLLDTAQAIITGLDGETLTTTDYRVMVNEVRHSPILSDSHFTGNNQYLSVISVLCKVYNN